VFRGALVKWRSPAAAVKLIFLIVSAFCDHPGIRWRNGAFSYR